MKKTDFRFTKWEWGLWSVSVTVILLSFFAFGGDDLLTLTAAVTFAFWWILKAFHTAVCLFL